MKFRNSRTGEELRGSKQIGNRLRYQFGRFSQQHEGEYICEARNAYGEKANKTAYIKMECKLTISSFMFLGFRNLLIFLELSSSYIGQSIFNLSTKRETLRYQP